MRIAIGGISHETNSYCRDQTPIEDFQIMRGAEIIDTSRNTRTYYGGMIDACDELGAEIVPLLASGAQPSGIIERAAYESMRDELVDMLRAAMPVDAVALSPHGAGTVDGIDDLESDLARAVREVVGPDVPITAALDLHGNITDAMGEAYDAMFGVHYYPHTDMYERGYESVMILPDLVEGRVKPTTHVEHLPILLPTTTTNFGPAADVNKVCWEMEDRDGVIDCTFFHGFPYTDIPDVGCHIVCVTDDDPELAKKTAQEVAAYLWEHIEEFRPDVVSPADAIQRALAVDGGPVVINDTADNCGGGTPGDATHVLRAMIEADLQDACFGFMVDPEVVQQSIAAGVGSTIDVSLGGKYDDLHGAPLELEDAYVKVISDGKWTLRALGEGMQMDLGPMVRLVVGGIDIVVGSRRSQTIDDGPFLCCGIDLTRYKIVALKSSNHFRAYFEPVAKQIITADSPGLTTLRTEVFERSRNKEPLWPRDAGAKYTPSA